MHPHQSTDKFFELFDSCQQIIDSIRFDLNNLRRSHCGRSQLKLIKSQVDELQKCSFEFASIGINEVFYDFSSRIDIDSADPSYVQALAILLRELDLAYTDFFKNLRVHQSLNSNGYYLQKHNKRDLI